MVKINPKDIKVLKDAGGQFALHPDTQDAIIALDKLKKEKQAELKQITDAEQEVKDMIYAAGVKRAGKNFGGCKSSRISVSYWKPVSYKAKDLSKIATALVKTEKKLDREAVEDFIDKFKKLPKGVDRAIAEKQSCRITIKDE